MNYQILNTPIGALRLISDGRHLTGVEFAGQYRDTADDVQHSDAVLDDTRRQLLEYFAGDRRHFELPLRAEGTAFQQQVWGALSDIPYGEVRSYSEIAGVIHRPKAVRAVGAANGRNPLPVIVPCHRVIGRDGSLTGFAGGLAIKKALLTLENAL